MSGVKYPIELTKRDLYWEILHVSILRLRRNMTAATPKRPRGRSRAKHDTSIPRGDAPLTRVNTDVLREMHKELSGGKKMSKEALIIAAAIKRRERFDVSEIARQLLQPRSTVHDWLVRLRNRGLEDILDRAAPNHKPMLDDIHWIVIGVWPSHTSQAYGFESGLWQTSMVRKMILDLLGIDIKPRTLRGTLKRMGLSFWTLREVLHTSPRILRRAKSSLKMSRIRWMSWPRRGTPTFTRPRMLLSAHTARGWLPRGDRETLKITFSMRSVKVFGALGGWGTACDTDKIDQIRGVQDIFGGSPPKVWQGGIRNGQRRISQVIYHLEISGVDRQRCGPDMPAPYTPQLNPIEVQWRMIKARLACRYHSTRDEMEISIIKLVESGEVQPVQISNLPFA